jgi:NAD(P)-dependent dehydrogenase (short-subunit alcohol dehydrogenase family)
MTFKQEAQTKRVMIVTGASSGIGRQTALHLASLGWHVLAGVRKAEDGQTLGAEDPTGCVQPVQLDVTKHEDLVALEATVAKAELEICGLINNAGHNYMTPFECSQPERLRAMMEVNLFGLAALTQALLPHLRASAKVHGRAHIINIGSIGSLVGVPWEPWYHASKFALLGLSESLQNETYNQGIRVCVVCPGGIRTPFIAKSEAEASVSLSSLTVEHQALYGKGMQALVKASGAVERFGTDPSVVARAIANLLNSKNPPFRKLVGMDAHIMAALQNVLPRRWLHSLLRESFGG